MKWTKWVVGLIVVLALLQAFVNACNQRGLQIIAMPAPTRDPLDRYVRYEIHDGAFAHFTLISRKGETEQYYDHLPYSLEFPARSGQTLSVSATDTGYGQITCEIYIDDQKITAMTATGKYSTVTCSGAVP